METFGKVDVVSGSGTVFHKTLLLFVLKVCLRKKKMLNNEKMNTAIR